MDPGELTRFFENVRDTLQTAYLAKTEPWSQSGMSGPEVRWISLRKLIADCIDRPGSFLDIGCANGYLLACCLGWTAERGIRIEPFGLDVSPGLLPGCHPTRFLLERLAELRLAPVESRAAFDPVKRRRTRVAVLTAQSILD